MIRAYKLQHSINQNKLDKISAIISEYRLLADKIAHYQWLEFIQFGEINKNYSITFITTKLSERYKQTCQYQVIGTLESYLSNISLDFKSFLRNSSLDEITLKQLYFINKYKMWFHKFVSIRNKLIDNTVLKLARKIFHKIMKYRKFPSFKNYNLALDNKVAKIRKKGDVKVKKGKSIAKSFDYWIQLSTLEYRKTIMLPLSSNDFEASKIGSLKNFIQINSLDNIAILKDITKREYIPEMDNIGIDTGLVTLLTTSNGQMYGNGLNKKLYKFDAEILQLQKKLQKRNIKLNQSIKYKRMIKRLKSFLKNEVNRAVNLLIKNNKPARISIERLDFSSPKLSRRMNRILKNFGKGILSKKLESISEEYGIIIEEVNPAYTSKECSSCGYIAKNNRKNQETFTCGFCKKKQNADVNASKNILTRSSCELKDIYIKRRFILDKLITRFIERQKCHYSMATIYNKVKDNPYFIQYYKDNKLIYS